MYLQQKNRIESCPYCLKIHKLRVRVNISIDKADVNIGWNPLQALMEFLSDTAVVADLLLQELIASDTLMD